jgi:hypothetical protein
MLVECSPTPLLPFPVCLFRRLSYTIDALYRAVDAVLAGPHDAVPGA